MLTLTSAVEQKFGTSTQVLFAWTLGAVGLLIAVPLVAVVLVAVQILYVEDFLGDRLCESRPKNTGGASSATPTRSRG